MGHIPRVPVAPCPHCRGICGDPKVMGRLGWRAWFRFRLFWRLTCPCGVSGADGDGDRAYLVQLYRAYLERPEQADLVAKVRDQLRGKNLACWCPLDGPCHADVLLSVANAERGSQ